MHAQRLPVAAAVAALMLTPACAADTTTPPTWAPVAQSQPTPDCAGVAIVGDSITSWSPPYALNPAQTWVTTAVVDGVTLAGGWARPGAELREMLANVQPSPAACYLILMGGTNDIVGGIPVAARMADVDAIVATVDAEHVILSAVAPLGLDPQAAVDWNAALRAHAATSGLTFVDPWEDFRASDGTWVAGGSLKDGVHPTAATAAWVGHRIAAHIERLTIVDQAEPSPAPDVI
jgi:lysophospholipase L1-like esterase